MKEIDKIRAQIEQSQVVLKSVEELIPYAKNSRKHSPEQITKIASSIKHYGFTNPVLIRKDGDILAGHGRVMAAKKLKLTEVPCIVLDMNDVDARAYVIADNQLALTSEWDEDILKSEIDALGQDGFELDLLGFDNGFLSIDEEEEKQQKKGSKELLEADFSEFAHKCPKCGFEFGEK